MRSIKGQLKANRQRETTRTDRTGGLKEPIQNPYRGPESYFLNLSREVKCDPAINIFIYFLNQEPIIYFNFIFHLCEMVYSIKNSNKKQKMSLPNISFLVNQCSLITDCLVKAGYHLWKLFYFRKVNTLELSLIDSYFVKCQKKMSSRRSDQATTEAVEAAEKNGKCQRSIEINEKYYTNKSFISGWQL